jgi:molybdopterin-biosynthesis enzyme MoeA-like protein
LPALRQKGKIVHGPRIGLYVIGDEILSGRREDRHLGQVIAILDARRFSLGWARFLPDDRATLEAEFRRSLATDDIVFSCGGIGATPDDHTRQAAAAALGVDLVLHAQAREAIIAALQRRGVPDLDGPAARQALRMGEFPRGATAIENPYNGIPGFAVARHHFVPGFPVMAWPMIEGVLDTNYRALAPAERQAEHSLLAFELAESSITPLLQEIEERFAGVKTFSLPSVGDGRDGRPARRHIELGVKGPAAQAAQAFARVREGLASLGAETAELRS